MWSSYLQLQQYMVYARATHQNTKRKAETEKKLSKKMTASLI